MSLESELKKLTEQVKRVADRLEAGAGAPVNMDLPDDYVENLEDLKGEEPKSSKPAQTEGKAERQPSKGQTRKPKDPNPDDPGEAEEAPQKIPAEDAKLLRKQAGEKLMDLIGAKGKPAAIKLLEEFDAKVLKDVPAERLSDFMAETEQLMEAK